MLDKGDDQYLNFEVENAVPTYDIMGKHIFEFRRQTKQNIPEIFLLLVSFFDVHSHLLKTEGLFRIAASMDRLDELQTHL